MSEKYKQLQYDDRLRMEKMFRLGLPKTEIAKRIQCHRNTVSNEFKRGKYSHRLEDYTEEYRYSAELAEEKYQEGLRKRGTSLKIGNDYEYATYLETEMLEKNYSPEAVLGELKASGKENDFQTKVCASTLYSYISKGVFLYLTNKDLPTKGKRKRTYKKVKRQKRASVGESISERPEEVESRSTFGHWEMDTVIGNKKSKNVLLVLTERKTRMELLFKMASKEAKEVVKRLDELEAKWGEQFSELFKTITVDNGTEFSYYNQMQRSIFGGCRTKVFYCHAYSSWERGSNENQNKMVRRKIPKGSSFDDKTEEDIADIEEWINNYPRKIFNFRSAKEMFEKEIAFKT